MLPIKKIVVRNIWRITLMVAFLILLLSVLLQISSVQKSTRRNAMQIFGQVEQILEENTTESQRTQEEYRQEALKDAQAAGYFLYYNPEARYDCETLQELAGFLGVDEIHIFSPEGVIVGGTHPEYYGLSFDSGEQMAYFKPLLSDPSLSMVQDIMPNTATGKLVQYSALWGGDGEFILQVGLYPASVLRVTEKNELSYIFSLLRAGVSYSLYAIQPDSGMVVGATVMSDLGKSLDAIGFREEQLKSQKGFFAHCNGTFSYCLCREIDGNWIVWTKGVTAMYRSVLSSEMLLLTGLALISLILVYSVSRAMNRAVIDPIHRVNKDLRFIQGGGLNTKVDVQDSREFAELSSHINDMVDSLLESSEKLQLSEQIKKQKDILEHQRERLEAAVKQAREASKAKSDFLFNMSHDIRTPMNAILGFTHLALENEDPKVQREYLENIDIASKQLLDLINNVLELSRIENRKVIIDEKLVEVNYTCRQLCTILDSDLKRKNLHFTVDLQMKDRYLYADIPHFSQVFLNIASNAIKYTPEGGRIDVSFRELPGDQPGMCFVETVVKDSGIGMSPEFLEKAYESFARERTSTISGIQGTGLGLAIVKNLVDLMHGTIQIESRQGEGTTVTVRIPHRVGTAPEEVEKPKEIPADLLKDRRILMAEDIDINAVITTKLLTSRGAKVDRAKDGAECVEMLKKAEPGTYDLILMDIQMPVLDGYGAAQAIRALEDPERDGIPILALTANAFQEDCDRAIEAGMNGHVAKPLDAMKLFQAIMGVLGERT